MTEKEKIAYNHLLRSLRAIANYQTPSQLRRTCEKEWGTDYLEALEMSYENIQQTAKDVTKGLREKKVYFG